MTAEEAEALLSAPEPPPKTVAWPLRLLGERPEESIVVGAGFFDSPEQYAKRVAEIRQLFPEADAIDMAYGIEPVHLAK